MLVKEKYSTIDLSIIYCVNSCRRLRLSRFVYFANMHVHFDDVKSNINTYREHEKCDRVKYNMT